MSKKHRSHSLIIFLLFSLAAILIMLAARPGAASPPGIVTGEPVPQQAPGVDVDTGSAAGVQGNLPEIVGRAQQAMILLERAENILIDKCMEESGFEFHGPTNANVPLRVSQEMIGVLQPEIAERLGYSPYLNPPSEEDTQMRERIAAGNAYFESLAPDERVRYIKTLEGQGDQGAIETNSGMRVLVDGCIGEARRTLLGDRLLEVFDTFTLVQFLQPDAWAAPEVISALKIWKNCMGKSGFLYEHPNDAVGRGLELRGNSPEASQAEIELASADANCRIQAGLTPLLEDTAARLARDVVDSNQQLLTAWAEIEQFVRERAANVSASAQGS